MQVQDQPALWSQSQAALQKLSPLQMSMKQQQQFFMVDPDALKLYEQQLPGPQPHISNMDKKMKFPDVKMQDFYWEPSYRMDRMGEGLALMAERMKRAPPAGMCAELEGPAGPRGPSFELPSQSRMESSQEAVSQSSSLLPSAGFPMQDFTQNSIFSQAYGKNLPPSSKADAPMMQQEPSLYSLFEGNPWSPSLPASSDHSTPASQSPHSSNPSSLPSSPPTHNHGAASFSNFGPIGTPDSRDRRVVDRWKAEKPGTGFGLDYLPAAASAAPPDSSWHQAGSAGSSWTNQESPMEESSSTVLLDSLKSIWSSSMMQPGPSALEQLLLQQKQKLQRGHGAMNPPH